MDMITPVLNSILNFMFSIAQAFLYAFLAVFVPLCVMIFFNFVYHVVVKRQKLPRRKKKRTFHYNERFNPVKLIFWDFPKRLMQDYFNRNPDNLTFTAFTFSQASREAARASPLCISSSALWSVTPVVVLHLI